jgi:hypothetical protein
MPDTKSKGAQLKTNTTEEWGSARTLYIFEGFYIMVVLIGS